MFAPSGVLPRVLPFTQFYPGFTQLPRVKLGKTVQRFYPPTQNPVQNQFVPYRETVVAYSIYTCIYEGHPINKLLNGIILSIFKIWKIRDIRFVGNLFLNTSCEFHYGDIIMMTSHEFWTQSASAVFYPAVFLHYSWALDSIARYEKNEQVYQADL